MDALEAIRKRRSIRKFTGQSISKEDLEVIVDAGRLAATGSNFQPWDFIVITEPEAIVHFSAGAEWVANAGALIVVVLNPQTKWAVEDGAAATQNMLIAVTSLGYGGCWLEGTVGTREQDFKDYLHIPDDKRIFTLVAIGVPDEEPVKEKRSLNQVLHWEKY